jgi:Zn-dependent peptidase ImmA (M78 family)
LAERQERFDMDLRKTAEEIDKAVLGVCLEGRRRYLIWDHPPEDPVSRIDLDLIATLRLGVQLLPIRERDLDGAGYQGGNLPVRVGAVIDRNGEVIRIDRRLRRETQRFTLGLAIAHWVLHPRNRSLTIAPALAGHRPGTLRTAKDADADLFVEQLLMPKTLVCEYFQRVFGRPTLRDQRQTEVFARWLGRGVEYRVPASTILVQGRHRLALLAAEFVSEEGGLPSMADRFRVSCMAMAMRLERLGLI